MNTEIAFTRISRHPSHRVGVKCNLSKKTFQRQLMGIKKLFRAHSSWWRLMLLGKNMTCWAYSDIYEHCRPQAMALLKMGELNETQQEDFRCLRNLPNGIDLITGSAITGKTAFIKRVGSWTFSSSPISDHSSTFSADRSLNATFLILQHLFSTIFYVSETIHASHGQSLQVITLMTFSMAISHECLCAPQTTGPRTNWPNGFLIGQLSVTRHRVSS